MTEPTALDLALMPHRDTITKQEVDDAIRAAVSALPFSHRAPVIVEVDLANFKEIRTFLGWDVMEGKYRGAVVALVRDMRGWKIAT